jgi:cytochrome P450
LQFVPFTQGPRNCLGQHFALLENRVLLAVLLQVGVSKRPWLSGRLLRRPACPLPLHNNTVMPNWQRSMVTGSV